jgi:hypothetical protein
VEASQQDSQKSGGNSGLGIGLIVAIAAAAVVSCCIVGGIVKVCKNRGQKQEGRARDVELAATLSSRTVAEGTDTPRMPTARVILADELQLPIFYLDISQYPFSHRH